MTPSCVRRRCLPRLVGLLQRVREEQRHRALLEGVDEEECGGDEGDAVKQALEETLHHAVLGRDGLPRLHDPVVLGTPHVALHARLDRVHRVRDDAGEQRAAQRAGGERRVALPAGGLDELLLDQRRHAQHRHGEHRLAPHRHRRAARERRGAVLLHDPRGSAERAAAEALLLDHAQLPDAARDPRREPAQEGAAYLHPVLAHARAREELLEEAGRAKLDGVGAAQVHARHRQAAVHLQRAERALRRRPGRRDRQPLLLRVFPHEEGVIARLGHHARHHAEQAVLATGKALQRLAV
eukprot:CAMPEP_0185483542 /NCGR_PEP_ID=MMETSP1366-20130426/8635_1 /TAXON_ID=38817 /ORGANISM="Gephyrocapsa oceanica, Strain RCC1303" /LENGTH=295 /DNA_ID=CAMNT_0028091501 /DNA_START=133 /DNA_END=1016 /DNA_ORIENTATION=-